MVDFLQFDSQWRFDCCSSRHSQGDQEVQRKVRIAGIIRRRRDEVLSVRLSRQSLLATTKEVRRSAEQSSRRERADDLEEPKQDRALKRSAGVLTEQRETLKVLTREIEVTTMQNSAKSDDGIRITTTTASIVRSHRGPVTKTEKAVATETELTNM